MSKFVSTLLCFWLLLSIPTALFSANIFPYDFKIETLENGLTVVSIPLDNPHIISYYTIVRSGSRNEIEPGKSGFAHFFEHMMFKGTKDVPTEAYNDFFFRYSETPLLVINASEIDFVHNEEDLNDLLQQILNPPTGMKYYVPRKT